MNEFLRKFDTIRFVTPWSIFRNFSFFLNLNLNFEFGSVWYRPKPKLGRTSLTGNRSNRIGSHGLVNPAHHTHRHPSGENPRCDTRAVPDWDRTRVGTLRTGSGTTALRARSQLPLFFCEDLTTLVNLISIFFRQSLIFIAKLKMGPTPK